MIVYIAKAPTCMKPTVCICIFNVQHNFHNTLILENTLYTTIYSFRQIIEFPTYQIIKLAVQGYGFIALHFWHIMQFKNKPTTFRAYLHRLSYETNKTQMH